MARKAIPVQYLVTSDLSGDQLDNDGWSNVKFTMTVDDTPTEYGMLDLSVEERETLKAILSPYFDAAKRVNTYAAGKAKPASGSNESLQAIRAWAIKMTPENGTDVDGKPKFDTYNVTVNGKEEKLERPAVQGRLSQVWKDAYAAMQEESARQDAEGHASEDTLNAAIADGEAALADMTDTTPAFSDAKPGKSKK